MKNFFSSINYVEKKHMMLNRDYVNLFKDIQFNSFESVWKYQNGETIKKIKARTVIRFAIRTDRGKKYFYLKRHNTKFVGVKRFLSLFFPKLVLSEGKREFENIRDFQKGGFRTVLAVAAGEKFINFFWVQSFLITEDFSPFISLEYILRDNPEFFKEEKGYLHKKKIINKIGKVAKKMHKMGFNHRDFNATHILLDYKDNLDVPDIALFDLQRVDRISIFRFRWIIKSLAELNYTLPAGLFDEEDRICLLLSYKGKKKLNAWDRLQWLWIKRKTGRIKRHTDKIIDRKQRKKY